jgi:cytidylate kinase
LSKRVSVICISRSLGARGEEIGAAVARALDFRHVDDEIVLAAARKEQLDPSDLERVEHPSSGLGRLISDFVTGGALDEMLRQLVKQAILDAAEQGKVVIVAHAASHALAERPNVLRVLITGSPETRARRLATSSGAGEQEALEAIEQSDHNRAGYLAQFYGVEQEQPAHYDLVVNTDHISAGKASALIVEAARQ